MKIIWSIALFVLTFGVLQSNDVRAASGVGQQSQSIFSNMMSNSTDPSVSLNAQRGVITGGSLTIRNRITNVPLYNIQLPTINAGCGGIDAFMGSFTFISTDQLVAALRNIASAALGYAFQLALKAMCPSCEDVMSKLQAMMNSFNSGAMNSCQIAKSVMDSTGASQSITDAFKSVGQQTGIAGWTNNFDTNMWGHNDQSTNSVFMANAPDIGKNLMWGNVVWRVMQQRNSLGAFINGNNSLLQDLMSITGTVVVCVQGQGGCALGDTSGGQYGPPAPQTTQVFVPLLKVHDLVYGDPSLGPTPASRYQCDTAVDQFSCLQPSEVSASDIVGVKKMIEDIMLGTGAGEGMIDALWNGDRTATAQEQALMFYGGEYVQLAVKLARKNTTAAKDFVQMFSGVIATEFVVELLDADIKIVMSALNGLNQNGVNAGAVSQTREMVIKASKDAHEDLIKEYAAAKNNGAVLEYFSQQVAVMEKSKSPVQPVGTSH